MVFVALSLAVVVSISFVAVPVRADYVYKFIDLDKFGKSSMRAWDRGRCGQSAVASAINYFLGYRALTDDSVAQYTGSHWYGLTTGQIQDAASHFAGSYGLQGRTWTVGFDTNIVVHQIDLGHPVIVTMTTWYGGHASVIIGYRFDPNTGDYTPYTYDLGDANGWMRELIVLDLSAPQLSVTLSVSPQNGQAPFTPSWSTSYSGTQGPVTLVIDFGDGTTFDVTNCGNNCPSHTYTVSGTYTIRISVTDSSQSTASDSKTITVSPPPPPQCSGGQYWNGQQCVCPSGQTWNGQQCVSPPPPPPPPPSTGNCGGIPISIGPVFSLTPQTMTTNVYVWAFPMSYLGQDPATQIPSQADVHATISVMYCSNGNRQQGQYVTPFVLSADQGSAITLSVMSPSGFGCIWDHYGYQQHQTCTLTISVGNNDKIVAYFNQGACCIIQPVFDVKWNWDVIPEIPSLNLGLLSLSRPALAFILMVVIHGQP